MMVWRPRASLKQTIRACLVDLFPGLPIQQVSTWIEPPEDARRWLAFNVTTSNGIPMAPPSRRMTEFTIQIQAFATFARDQADLDSLAVDRMMDMIEERFGGQSIEVAEYDQETRGAPRGHVQLDDGREIPIPELGEDPGISGLGILFLSTFKNI